jgi:diguanylate cyclase (GGDEF)-like protein/PAS domain S-box-containing protein
MGSEGGEVVVRMARSEGAIITGVSREIVELLGHRPDDLIGTPSTEWVHPDDQAAAVQAWMTMLAAPGSVGTWVGRYRNRDGTWSWIETENVNRLDDRDHPRVETTMRHASVEVASVEEELRRREELISRLTDAIPLGVFQVDDRRRMILTNDRLGHILGRGDIPTTEHLATLICDEDRHALDEAIEAVLHGEPVDDIEVRLVQCEGNGQGPDAQFCRFSMRALTDASGAVNGAIGCVQDVTDSVVLRQSLELRASTDALTGCLNRSAIEMLLRQLLGMSTGDSGLAVAFIDLDDFKQVNDSHGHAAGDLLLIAAGERLRGAVRACDHVGRFGGDEFLVLCPDVTSKALATRIANRLAVALRGTVATDDNAIDLHASIGVAWARHPTCGPNEMVRRADEAMYAAKGGSRPAVLVI